MEEIREENSSNSLIAKAMILARRKVEIFFKFKLDDEIDKIKLDSAISAYQRISESGESLSALLTNADDLLGRLLLSSNDDISEVPGEEEELEIEQFQRKEYMRKTENSHLKCKKLFEEIASTKVLYGPSPFQGKFHRYRLREFRMPEGIRSGWANSMHRERAMSILTPETYMSKFQTLVWLEESQNMKQTGWCMMEDVMINRVVDDLYCLTVPGLEEGQPSLIRGDRVILRAVNSSQVYQVFVSQVHETDMVFAMPRECSDFDHQFEPFDVMFLPSRLIYKRQHDAITKLADEQFSHLENIVFPKNSIDPTPLVAIEEDQSEVVYFDHSLNDRQRRAVIKVCEAECRPAPYVIFGPPGTGKTKTLVECILQICKRKPNAKILACVNSNASSDNLASSLLKSEGAPVGGVIRFLAFHRYESGLDQDLADISKTISDLDERDVDKYQVIVSTCTTASALQEINIEFDYVFVDEAGRSTEPEALVPIVLLKPSGCVVVAGDHKQLDPVVMSTLAKQFGLRMSYLERLMDMNIYKLKHYEGYSGYDETFVTQLTQSYRFDDRIMGICNELFYNNSMRFGYKADERWMRVFNASLPLIFHDVKGKEMRIKNNTSWFNPFELIVSLGYITKLYRSGLRPEQLGVVTPYKTQMKKLKNMFQVTKTPPCKISTMDEIQGDEREVILISTVRSLGSLKNDDTSRLGFLFDPKRFSTAISRAKSLVILVGDGDTLRKDNCWRKYIKSSHEMW